MRRRWLPTPERPTRGDVEGRPYLLWLPDTPPPWPGIVICHGAGSRKENHADFGRACAAAGWAAIAYDQRGHGEAGDEVSPRMIDDVSRVARALAGHDGVDPARVCARGSSLGGFIAIHAAATSVAIAGVIAVCPAGERHLLRGLRDGSLEVNLLTPTTVSSPARSAVTLGPEPTSRRGSPSTTCARRSRGSPAGR